MGAGGLGRCPHPLHQSELLRVARQGRGGMPTLQKVILQWQELSCVFRMSTSP